MVRLGDTDYKYSKKKANSSCRQPYNYDMQIHKLIKCIKQKSIKKAPFKSKSLEKCIKIKGSNPQSKLQLKKSCKFIKAKTPSNPENFDLQGVIKDIDYTQYYLDNINNQDYDRKIDINLLVKSIDSNQFNDSIYSNKINSKSKVYDNANSMSTLYKGKSFAPSGRTKRIKKGHHIVVRTSKLNKTADYH